MILVRFSSTRCLVNEVPHALLNSPTPSLPYLLSCDRQVGDFEGHGIVWNCSLTSWRLSGDPSLRIGQSFPRMNPSQRHPSVSNVPTLSERSCDEVCSMGCEGGKTADGVRSP